MNTTKQPRMRGGMIIKTFCSAKIFIIMTGPRGTTQAALTAIGTIEEYDEHY